MNKYYYGNGEEVTNALKNRRMSDWKRQGVKCREGETYEDLHNIYHDALICEACKMPFEGGRGTNTGQTATGKCLDHDHNTGYFRQIICRRCNTMDSYYKYYMAEWCKDIAVF
jgi:hypothetical protein